MILKKLVIKNIGPYSIPTMLEIHPGVTILIGANDVGKSYVLKVIETICSVENASLQEDDINNDRLFQTSNSWKDDQEVNCLATFKATSKINQYIQPSNVKPRLTSGDEIDLEFILVPRNRTVRIIGVRSQNGKKATGQGWIKYPQIINLTSTEEIGSIIDLESPNTLEGNLLNLAFGDNVFSRFSDFNEINLTTHLISGAKRINSILKSTLPSTSNLAFKFDKVSGTDKLKIAVNLIDDYHGYSHIGQRGSGVKKILTILVILMIKRNISDQVIVLFDEPENSLHADSQHKLRHLFEDLSKDDNMQVIYATHSPSMVNPYYVDGLRLLEREIKDDKAITTINNRPYRDNYFPVRSSLGLSPSDSLLYAPITIITDGLTEVLGIPLLLQKLHQDKIDGFEEIDVLLPLAHFLDGHGTSFEYFCRLAESQGSRAIIFLDSDMRRQVNRQDVHKKHPDVPIIFVNEDNMEFEDIVPREDYFNALQELTGNQDLTLSNFSDWEKEKDFSPDFLFSKRIKKWINENFENVIYDKALVMKEAIKISDSKSIKTNSILTLVNEMKSIANQL